MLEPDTFDRIPKDTAWSIERSFFPSLIERGETFVAYVYDGYWIDIGTPAKYLQVHRDIMDGRYLAPPFDGAAGRPWVVAGREGRRRASSSHGPCFVDEGVVVKAGAHGPALLGHRPPDARRGRRAVVDGSIIWPNGWIGPRGASCAARSSAATATSAATSSSRPRSVLGDKTVITDYSRL